MSYANAKQKYDETHVNESMLPCLWCHGETLKATLAQYGGRCLTCYDSYCCELQPPGVASDKRTDPKDWALALKDRELNHRRRLADGRLMTPAQRAMWRVKSDEFDLELP